MGIPLNDTTLYKLWWFVHDQIFLAQDYEDFEYMTRKLLEENQKCGLEINIKKTDYMCFGGEQQILILEEQRKEINFCKIYKYI